ncbi:BrnT family toxin [Geothrix sp. 21YS21S-2]|uniref:BrnT family toxin n=1 Tax=Geothrix sp. 21YS21S-2 TaxID=3068893 RepID=UPI0027B8FA0A|nr:BrnT family toxin [Geothrix sp. 21YS21S-2]
MDVIFIRNGQAFEWDAGKALLNLKKHGVSFERASEVFFDPFIRRVDASDREQSRDAALGYSEEGALLFVVHRVRHEKNHPGHLRPPSHPLGKEGLRI